LKDNPSTPISNILPLDVKGKVDLSTVLICQVCYENFGFFGAVKLQCPVCLQIVCKKCQNSSHGIQLPPPHVGKVVICKLCKQSFTRAHEIERFKLSVENSKNSRIILWYNTLMAIRRDITLKMPQFNGLAISLTGNTGNNVIPIDKMDPAYIFDLAEVNTSQYKMMELNFRNFENRLKLIIKSYQPKSKREETIKKHIQLASIQFLEKELPLFNTLSINLLNFLSSPELKKALKDYVIQKDNDKEREDQNQLEEHRRALGLIEKRTTTTTQSQPSSSGKSLVAHSMPPSTTTTTTLTPSSSFSGTSIVSLTLPTFSTKNLFSSVFGTK